MHWSALPHAKLLPITDRSIRCAAIKKLVLAFEELRLLTDKGVLAYPYCTRDCISVVKHLEKFPNEPLFEYGNELNHNHLHPLLTLDLDCRALSNVIAFDMHDDQTKKYLAEVMAQHGIELPAHILGLTNRAIVNARKLYAPLPPHCYQRHSSRSRLINPQIDRPRLTIWKENNSAPSSNPTCPKHGKVDPNNEPHVGGNTWAGGTGGRDTAGLGGRGGPYRLDAGHTVHQVSQADKDNVDPRILEAAREMAQKALAERLKEIGMTHHQLDQYLSYRAAVAEQIDQLRNIVQSLRT